MRAKLPSPAMVVAFIALCLALSGGAFAAVRATSVDGFSAVGASSSLKGARGKLVAVQAGGRNSGRLPDKFVANVVRGEGLLSTFARAQAVTDNATGAANTLAVIPGFGTITSTCRDQNGAANKEDPSQTLTFTNQSATGVNYARFVAGSPATVASVASGTIANTVIAGSNAFEIVMQSTAGSVTVRGIIRQDGRNTPSGQCFTAAQVLQDL